MKNKTKLIGVFILITLIAITMSCKEEGEEEGNTDDANTTITGSTIGTGMTVKYSKDYLSDIADAKKATNFGYLLDWDDEESEEIASPISNFLNGSSSVTVKDEKVDIILGTPKSSYMKLVSDGFPSSLTITPGDAKFYAGEVAELLLLVTSKLEYSLLCLQGDKNLACLIFADKDVTIKGDVTNPDSSVAKWNCALKQGWNYLIIAEQSGNTTNITASQKKPEVFEWTVVENDKYFN